MGHILLKAEYCLFEWKQESIEEEKHFKLAQRAKFYFIFQPELISNKLTYTSMYLMTTKTSVIISVLIHPVVS